MPTDPKIPHAARFLARSPHRKTWVRTGWGLIGVTSLVTCLGCQQIKEHFNRVRPNNPVVGPPPPRLTMDDSQAPAGQAGVITQTAALESGSKTGEVVPLAQFEILGQTEISESTVVAIVNSNQILAGDVFGAYSQQMEKMKAQLTPEQFAQAQRDLLKRDLPDHIERTLLAHALKTSLKQEQVEKLDQVLDEAFNEHVGKLLEKTGTGSAMELNEKLKKEGTSLDDLRKTFGKHQLAMQYLATESEVNIEIGRQELLDYYNAHLQDYSHPSRVKWQELRISFGENGGRNGALEKLNEAVKDLQEGVSFGEVAKKHSDGPTATLGGEWDWTIKGSLADEEVNNQLFTLPVGGISKIMETPDYFRVVRVVTREDAHITPFEELQLDIRGTIIEAAQRKKTEEVVARLKKSATIETIFDSDSELYEKMRAFGKFTR